MSLFDSLLDGVWRIARSEEDFLTAFARLTSDRARVEKVLALPRLQDFCVTDGFSGKCETRAEDFTLQGDKLYQENPEQALAFYSSAIKHAPCQTELLARCYAGRSQVLLSLGYTELALRDVARALELQLPNKDAIKLLSVTASCHRQHGDWKKAEEALQQALNQLRNSDLENSVKAGLTGEIVAQLKLISQSKEGKKQNEMKKKQQPGTQKDKQGEDVPDLTFGKNKDIPAASSALEVRHSAEKGRYMIANRDIKLGSVLIVEHPYAWALSREAVDEHCLYCCRLVPAPIPCAQCSTVSYCNENCRDLAWKEYHRFECSVLSHLFDSKELSKMALLVYHIAAQLISSSKCNLETEENIDILSQKIDPSHIDTTLAIHLPFLSSDYTSVYGQITNSSSRTPADLLKRTTSAVFLMRCLKHVAPGKFDQVTMASTILRHLQSCSCNAYQITEQILPENDVRSATENELGGGVYPTISLCNHGCNPNVVRHSSGRNCIVRAIKAIKKGEEILDNYGPHFLSHTLTERQEHLETQYFFRCSCEACLNKWPTVNSLNDQAVQYRCPQCTVKVGNKLTALKICPHCKKKLDFGKIAKRLEGLSRHYNKALDDLIQRRFDKCLNTCVEYGDVMDSVVVHPNKQFVRCQQAITLCWSLLGNTNNKCK